MGVILEQSSQGGGGTLAGDVTGPAGSNTVVKVNNASLPLSKALVGTDGSGHIIDGTAATLPMGGDVTGTTGASSVVKVNGASVPASKALVGTNGSSQIIDAVAGFMSIAAYLPNAKFVDCYKKFTTPGNAFQGDLYTVPANKRAMILSYIISNASGGAASTFRLTVKMGGTYRPVAPVTASVAAAAGLIATAQQLYIAEAGEILSVLQATSTTFAVQAMAIEFDATSPMKTVKNTALATGDNTIYTCPGGKVAAFLPPLAASNFSDVVLYTTFTGTNNAIPNYVRSGDSASTSNRINTSAALTTDILSGNSGYAGITIAPGDSLSINMSNATPVGVIWANILEY